MRAENIDDAMAIADSTAYGLVPGVPKARMFDVDIPQPLQWRHH